MNINIIGSTGEIGNKTLYLITKFYPKIRINLLVANKNVDKLIIQCKKYNPKVIYINDQKKIVTLRKKISKKIRIVTDISKYLKSTKSNATILSVSGYQSLFYFNDIIYNTKIIGLVNKECIVSAGHIFKKILKKYNTKFFPLDSEHFSLNNFFNNQKCKYSNIYLTASGGPFFQRSFDDIKSASFEQASNHPKWKMGYKNSIDSATLVNKCLEIIEAHYLFDISYEKIKPVIHPEALIHSIIEFYDHTSQLNYFYNDMSIPIINFLDSLYSKEHFKENKTFKFNSSNKLSFYEVDTNNYPVYKIFKQINKSNPEELIKFNIINEFAIELFKKDKILFGDIHKIINNSLSINLHSSLNTIENILYYHEEFKRRLNKKYEYI